MKGDTHKSDVLDAINLVSGDCDMVSQNDVKSAIASLCVNKACGMDSLSAEHLLYASPEIHTLLAICFNAFIVHGFLHRSLTDSVIIPIVKDKCKNISDIGNYRPIALSSVLSKVFELILLIVQALYDMTSHKLQQKLFYLFCTPEGILFDM